MREILILPYSQCLRNYVVLVCCFVHTLLQMPLNAMRQTPDHAIIFALGSQSKLMLFVHSMKHVIGSFA